MKETIEREKNLLEQLNKYYNFLDEIINFRRIKIAPTPYIRLDEVGVSKLLFYSNNSVPGESKYHLLLVPSLINKPYIFDLLPNRSFIEYLISNGVDVYMIDWGKPNQMGRYYSFEDYICLIYNIFVEKVKKFLNTKDINIMGYCIGGTLSFIYASMYPKNVRSLINLASPIDFSNAGILRKWVDLSGIKVETIVEAFGNIPPEFMYIVFSTLKPVNRLTAIRTLIERHDDIEFIQFYKAMELWTSDNIPFPGKFGIQYINDFYKKNKLYKEELIINGEKINLKKYKNKFLNILSSDDHIVPLGAALIAEELIGSEDKKSLIYNNVGHVGLMVGNFAKNNTWKQIVKWIKED